MSVPDAPTFTSSPVVVDSTTVTVEFALGSNGGSDLLDIQYARDTDGYVGWSSFGLAPPLEGYTTATISGLTPPPNGGYKLRVVNAIGESGASAEGLAVLAVPAAPTLNSRPIIVSNTSISVVFTLGANGGSVLTDVQYARDTDGYTAWTSLGLTPPLEGQTTATITGLTAPVTGFYKLRSVNAIGNSLESGAEAASSAAPSYTSNWLTLSSTPFTAVSYDSTGQYIAAITEAGVFQTSSDYGQTFQTSGPTVLPMTSFGISSNRQIIYVSGADNIVYRSTDSGANFLSVTTGYEGTPLTSIITNAIGDYIFAVSNTGSDVILSADSGTTWSNQGAMLVKWNNIVCSENGNYVFAVGRDNVTDANVMYKSINYGAVWNIVPSFTTYLSSRLNRVTCNVTGQYVDVAAGIDGLYRSEDYGATWVNLNTGTNGLDWISIASDASGVNLIAGEATYAAVYNSIDAGATWTVVYSGSGQPVMVAIDPSGTYRLAGASGWMTYLNRFPTAVTTTWKLINGYYYTQVAIASDNLHMASLGYSVTGNNGIALSSNGGVDWTFSLAPNGGNVRYVVSSSDGQIVYMVEVTNSVVYRSANYGVTFSPLTNAPGDTVSIKCSSDGAYVFIGTSSGPVYVSSDSGANFTQTYSDISEYTRSIICSTSGQYVYVSYNDTPATIAFSSDYGGSFTTTTITDSTNAISCDQTGQYLFASTSGGVYHSTDYGATWTITSLTGYTSSIANSASGTIAVVVNEDVNMYYRTVDSGSTWDPIALLGSNIISGTGGYGASISPDGTMFIISASNPGTYFYPQTVPSTPMFTSQPTIVSSTSINVIFSIISNGGSALTDIEYARDTDGYTTWTSLGLTTPMEGQTNAIITGLTAPVAGNYKLRAVSTLGNSAESAAGLVEGTIPCFLEGSRILCQVGGVDKYVAIETIRPGTLVKTSLHGFQPVKLIGSRVMINAGDDKRDKNSLYLCTKANYPELAEDLTITGCHAILVDQITDAHRQGIIKTLERVFVTDKKYRLPACVDERAELVQTSGTFTVWHFALEHADIKMNYGVYAQGLLVESSPIWHMNTKNYTLVQ